MVLLGFDRGSIRAVEPGHVYTCMYIYICMYVRTYVSMQVGKYVGMYVCIAGIGYRTRASSFFDSALGL